ncbi:hypothetical protein PC123_g27616 [Phytophthora cactorum]|nr:hypothetical protein PC123_g27616 [Phytophthora cactorum]
MLTAPPAQQVWHQLFSKPRTQLQHHEIDSVPDTSPPVYPTDALHLPVIREIYDFYEPRPWPTNVYYIMNNIFNASRPCPIAAESTVNRYMCECDGGRCIADSGTRLTSGYVNAGMDFICDVQSMPDAAIASRPASIST